MGSRVPESESFGRQNADKEKTHREVRDALRFDGSQFVRLYEKMQALIDNLVTTVTGLVNTLVPALTYTRAEIDALDADVSAAKVSKSGDTMSGDLFIPGMTPAVSSYTIMYWDGVAGRLSKGASSEKYKSEIGEVDPASLGNLFPGFKRWHMLGGDGVWRYGYTAEQLAANPETEQFAIYERITETDDDGNVTGSHLARDKKGKPIPESIDFIGFMAAQIAQLNQRIIELEARG